MNNLLRDLSISTLLLVFVWLCGGIYLVGFWGTFNIDFLSFINLTDIPKNIIYPFTISLAYTAILTLIFIILIPLMSSDMASDMATWDTKMVAGYFKKPISLRVFMIQTFVFFLIIMLLAFVIIYLMSPDDLKFNKIVSFIPLAPIVTGLPFIFYLHGKKTVTEVVPNETLRFSTLGVLIFFILQCYFSGKLNGLAIYKNRIMDFIFLKKNDQLITEKGKPYKLISFVSGNVIISDTFNEQVLVINESSFEKAELYHFEYKRRSKNDLPVGVKKNLFLGTAIINKDTLKKRYILKTDSSTNK